MASTDGLRSIAVEATRATPSIVGLTAHLGRGFQRLATDTALAKWRSFPRTVGDLDATALSKIMGRNVTSVEILDGAAGTSSRSRLALTGDDVPRSVFVKMSAESAGIRMLGELANLGENEARFYNQLSAELSGVPRTHGASFDRLTGRFAMIRQRQCLPVPRLARRLR